VDSRNAKNLKELSFKLRRLKVFKALKRNGGSILRGLTIEESGEKRLYSYENTLTPIIGYVQKMEDKKNKTTKVRGIKGLERSYNNLLNNSKNGMLKGKRDVLSYISFNKNSIIKGREDGATLVLNIPLKLQKNIELILDKHKKKLNADEIMVSIMDSQTGKILTLATSNRFDPENIKQRDIPSLNVNAIEYQFEPGSIMKPIAIALAMDKGRIKKRELFKAYNTGKKANKKGEFPRGRYKLGRYTIKDDHKFKKHFLTVDDIFIFSSNIGTLQLAQRLSAKEFIQGLHDFGITKKTGIDLPYEKVGKLPSIYQFAAGERDKKDNVYKATVSYGQGMTSNFMQMMKVYSVFNNNGIITTPKLVSYLNLHDMQKIQLQKKEARRVIKEHTAKEIKRLLIKTVTQGTGKAAIIPGIEVGGKTGTANIAGGGKYLKKYISSFFGFANGNNNRYTIGVTVINPTSTGKYWYYYYASQSAVPVFRDMVQSMIQLGFFVL
jgi:cell division protein FtsI (penicillin-binding protein 3)